MKKVKEKIRKRARRKARIRFKMKNANQLPRMSVFKSNKFIYVQVIDDAAGKTLVSISNKEKDFSQLKKNVKDATVLGENIGKRLIEKEIHEVIFDRNGFLYHGVIKSIADGARKAGIRI